MQSSRQAHAQAGLKRTLSIRHLVMLSLGGSIGTGLFLASGAPRVSGRSLRSTARLCSDRRDGLLPDDCLGGTIGF